MRTSRQDELVGLLRIPESKIGIECERALKSVQGPLMVSLCPTNKAIIHVAQSSGRIKSECLLQRVLRLLQQLGALLGSLGSVVPSIQIVTHQDISQLAPGDG